MLRLPRPLVVLVLALAAASACALDNARRGGAGDSCTKTDDCEAPLACRAQVCVDTKAPPTTTIIGTGGAGGASTTSSTTTTTIITGVGGSGGASTSSTTTSITGSGGSTTTTTGTGGAGGGGGTTTTGAGGSGLDFEQCAACLDATCAAQEAACGPDCRAIEACIEALCAHMSAIGSPDEGACQVHCQAAHAGAKSTHLALVNCAASAGCGPCSSYPWDYDRCIEKASGGSCAAELAACDASADCQSYRDCLAVCSTLADCLACAAAPGGAAGATTFDAFQTCIADHCTAEAWIP
jgi:hypothetical protein